MLAGCWTRLHCTCAGRVPAPAVMVKAAAEGLGLQAVAADLGWNLKIRLWVDSTAAEAIVARIGLGKVRHMEVKYLWAQEANKNGRFEVRKVDGKMNPADVETKPESAAEMCDKLRAVGGHLVKRAGEGPWEKLVSGGRGSWADALEDGLW